MLFRNVTIILGSNELLQYEAISSSPVNEDVKECYEFSFKKVDGVSGFQKSTSFESHSEPKISCFEYFFKEDHLSPVFILQRSRLRSQFSYNYYVGSKPGSFQYSSLAHCLLGCKTSQNQYLPLFLLKYSSQPLRKSNIETLFG